MNIEPGSKALGVTPLRCGALLVVVLACLLLAGCRSHAARGGAAADGSTQVQFPDPARAVLKEGVFADPAALRRFAPGMSKEQVYALLGTPHFNEGMWGVRQWNYLLNFRAPPAAEYFTCQFQVRFDGKGMATGAYWKPLSCAAMVEPAPPPRAAAPAPLPREPLQLSADALFAFDSARLSVDGQHAVAGVLEQVRQASQVQHIRVVGHSDRIGPPAYNQALSLRRAQAVRAALLDGGVAAAAVKASGRGDAEPQVDCRQPQREALIRCLAPNRRVEISGHAQPD